MAWKTGTEVNEDMGNGVSGGSLERNSAALKKTKFGF
jgi:hypothetical protein